MRKDIFENGKGENVGIQHFSISNNSVLYLKGGYLDFSHLTELKKYIYH